jgi:hypothetical protein
MNLPFSIAQKLILLQNGEKIPFSKMKHPAIDAMLDNGILKKQIQGRSKALIYLDNRNSLKAYLQNHFGIEDLETYIAFAKKEDISRAEAIEISSNSKLKSIRTFKGFLVNSYEPVDCVINNERITIEPKKGTFTFIYDYENFIPSADITIVGIENPENFRHIQKQQKLFENIRPLFVSRYPQNKDLIRWLMNIPNNYLHFGDFDFAGINIYWNEYKRHLQQRAGFFLPDGIEELIFKNGNRELYNNQILQISTKAIDEKNVMILIELIEKYKKGLEQELLAKH